jgi:hypothetical protein
MHCGCPLPGETIGQKISGLGGKPLKNRISLVPPDDIDLLGGTHPSDHNAVYAFHHGEMNEGARKARQEKFKRRKERHAELVRKGKREPGRGGAHDTAFLMPFPLHHGGCAASGGVVFEGCTVVGVLELWQLRMLILNLKGSGGGSGGCAAREVACGPGGDRPAPVIFLGSVAGSSTGAINFG